MRKNIKKNHSSGLELETKKIGSGRHSCTRTGGRVQSFSCMFLAGNKNPLNPMIGFSTGKAKTNLGAKTKALRKASVSCAEKYVPYDKKTETIRFPMKGKEGATRIFLAPGSGLSVPDCARSFFEMIGVKNVSMKVIGPANKKNIIKAIMDVFSRSELYASSMKYKKNVINMNVDSSSNSQI
jgi:small subunit ribosomal protein S5